MHLADQSDLDAAVDGLVAADAAMAEAVRLAGRPVIRRRAPGFAGIVAIVASQQLSVAAASSIVAKLEAGLGALTAARFASADVETLRAHGLSRPKAANLKRLAEAVEGGHLDLADLPDDPDAAQAALVALPGIGPWTAEIYLLFCLGHGDVWPAGDLALQYAVQHLVGLEGRPSERAMREIAGRWKPWRGAAAFVLWTYYRALKSGKSGAPI